VAKIKSLKDRNLTIEEHEQYEGWSKFDIYQAFCNERVEVIALSREVERLRRVIAGMEYDAKK